VLHCVEARLRAICCVVDEQQQRGSSSSHQHEERGASGQARPDVIYGYSARTAETQTESTSIGNSYSSHPIVINSDNDDSEEESAEMERWMEESCQPLLLLPPSRVDMHPTVLDKLFQDAGDNDRWGSSHRMERSHYPLHGSDVVIVTIGHFRRRDVREGGTGGFVTSPLSTSYYLQIWL